MNDINSASNEFIAFDNLLTIDNNLSISDSINFSLNSTTASVLAVIQANRAAYQLPNKGPIGNYNSEKETNSDSTTNYMWFKIANYNLTKSGALLSSELPHTESISNEIFALPAKETFNFPFEAAPAVSSEAVEFPAYEMPDYDGDDGGDFDMPDNNHSAPNFATPVRNPRSKKTAKVVDLFALLDHNDVSMAKPNPLKKGKITAIKLPIVQKPENISHKGVFFKQFEPMLKQHLATLKKSNKTIPLTNNDDEYDNDMGDDYDGDGGFIDAPDMPEYDMGENDNFSSNTNENEDTHYSQVIDNSYRVSMSELHERVNIWQEKLAPVLESEANRPPFDIHKDSDELLDSLVENSGETRPQSFENVMKGKEKYEICRFFLATLQLANNGNLEIDAPKLDDNKNSIINLKVIDRNPREVSLDN